MGKTPKGKMRDRNNFLSTKESILFITLVGVLATLMGRYTFGISDQFGQVPMILRMQDSSYLVNDFFVNVSSTYVGPRFYFVKLFAMLGSFFSLPIAYLMVTVLCNTGICLITYLAARELSQNSDLSAMIACTLVMGVSSFKLGGSVLLHLSHLIPAFLALPFTLLSLWMAIKRRPIVCAVTAGAISSIHPLLGIGTGMIGLTVVVLFVFADKKWDNSGHRSKLKDTFGALSGIVILGIFAFFFWIMPNRDSQAISEAQFIDILAYFRHPHHYVPSTFGRMDYAGTLCFLSAFFMSWKWWYDSPSADKSLAWRVMIPSVIVLLLCVGGYVFVEIFPQRIWVTAQTFRFLFIIKWLGLIVISRTIAQFLEEKKAFDRPFIGWLMLAGSGAAQPLILFFGHMAEVFRKRCEAVSSARIFYLALGIILIAGSLILVEYGSARESLTVLIFVGIVAWFLFVPKRWYRVVVPAFLFCIFVSALKLNMVHGVPLLGNFFNSVTPWVALSDHEGRYVEAAEYARNNTEDDAIFLTPPSLEEFRLFARRAIVVDFKAFPFQDKALVEWRKRISDCYGDVKGGGQEAERDMDRRYRGIRDEKILSISEKYGATHAVLYKETQSGFPVVFSDGNYKIVKILRK